MKRILSLLLCCALAFGLAACGGQTGPVVSDYGSASSAPSSASDTDDASEASGKTDSDAVSDAVVFDPGIEHQILVCDIMNHSVVQLDLNVCNGDYKLLREESAVVWEWDADEDPNCHLKPGSGIDDAKIRYSPYYEKDVVIATSSGGKAYVVDYENRTVLWETSQSNGPHSIEMMPNGDVVVAGSGGSNWEAAGSLVYYPLSTGAVGRGHEYSVPSCHGVQWDPVQEVLWVLGYYGVEALVVKDGRLSPVSGLSVEFDGDVGGHDLAPVYGQPGKYWVTAHKYLWLFDSVEMTLVNRYEYSNRLSEKNLKGVASFADGTMVQCVANVGSDLHATWSTKALRILWPQRTDGKVSKVKMEDSTIMFSDREFYKVHTFCKDYQ